MFSKKNTNGFKEIIPGVHLNVRVHGESTMFCEFRLDKGALIPDHMHLHEQTGYLISGQLEFILENENVTANPGDSWCLKGHVSHSAIAHEACHLVEVFSPVREEYL